MRRSPLLLVWVVVLVVAVIAAVRAATAQDPAVVNATTVHVKLDNPRVRVLESALAPGEKEKLHSHPACVLYVIAGGKIRNHTADGKATEAELTTGDVVYREPVTHWAENVGSTTVRIVLVELKTGAATAPAGAR
jgi:quercetin dioxygenase-like cupin family protein